MKRKGLACMGAIAAVAVLVAVSDLAAGDPAAGSARNTNAAAVNIPTNGLVLYYSFDQNHGDIVLDQSGNGHTGTVCAATWTSNGVWGGAYEFDGVDDHLSVPDSDALSFLSGGMTVSAWVNRRAEKGGGSVLDKYKPPNGHEYAFGFCVCGRLHFWVYDDERRSAVGRKALVVETNSWHHVAAVYDGSGKCSSTKIYIDGMQSDNQDFSQGVYRHMQNTGAPVDIGNASEGFGEKSFFAGMMDEVRVYNRALSAGEVMSLYLHSQVTARVVPEETEKEIRSLIGQLGDSDPKVRKNAKAKLKAMGRKAFPVLVQYRNHADPEIRAAVQELLNP